MRKTTSIKMSIYSSSGSTNLVGGDYSVSGSTIRELFRTPGNSLGLVGNSKTLMLEDFDRVYTLEPLMVEGELMMTVHETPISSVDLGTEFDGLVISEHEPHHDSHISVHEEHIGGSSGGQVTITDDSIILTLPKDQDTFRMISKVFSNSGDHMPMQTIVVVPSTHTAELLSNALSLSSQISSTKGRRISSSIKNMNYNHDSLSDQIIAYKSLHSSTLSNASIADHIVSSGVLGDSHHSLKHNLKHLMEMFLISTERLEKLNIKKEKLIRKYNEATEELEVLSIAIKEELNAVSIALQK